MTPLLLGSLFELKYGKSLRKDTRNEGSIPVFGSNGQVDVHSESLVNHPTIVVGRKGSIGEVHLVKTPCWPIDTTYFVSPRDEHEFDLDWLYRLLRTLHLQDLNRSAAIPGLNRDDVYRIRILLPPIEDQIRIAHLLGKVEGLITQRKQHLQQLDDLLKSVFLEMFGDPVRNEKGWGKKQFSELLDDIESGKSPKCEAREAAADEWGVLKLGAVTRCRFDENENKALPQDVLPSVRDEVKAGDLLFSRKNTYDLVAACAYVFKARPKLLMPDLIFRFVFKKNAEINPIFIWKLLICDSQRKRIQSLAAGAAGSMPNISKANLKTVLLPIPPWPLQNQFATIVEKVEGIKSHYQQSLTDLEALYGALSQQAFKGELDLSRVLLPAQSIAPVAIGDQATVPEPVVQTVTTIHLPDTGNLPAALEDSEARKALIAEWLEAYRQQLGDAPFSVQDFMVAASDRFTEWLQTVVEDEGVTDEQKNRLAEFYPSNDVGLDVNDYEHIKKWVFEALVANRLTQSRNVTGYDEQSGEPIFGNLIELRASQT
ncbi:restriction endonuclease subunit S [Pseudomonas aeruginosa]|jgi:type I restriction enzyme S subunit|uniref:restriction endonuclease subunit S n=1 Tax=Pseudomonas aeruginosa TaxID=287 RepID=UPI0009A44F9A|nr:restriction endonuclease subunit S [Pseudomonas aeruginosa]EMB0807503.1 restriction endonuclease subunit S [Pseudomonas aeruginosa]MBG4385842.1 restriction endonuclease subunit S [Pseudomonas aeruginosa]MCO2426049.1 restriction endonuclease subunit S [Pseudomonas aeruginosa]MCO4044373.1 restriction endonuclease subunit S [Pseudomonas aeruginosa]MCQ9822540.1 restriction endonuclease subunit S [Pseudomonas aeruginosa]